ncbi:hypothetical protein ACIRST_14725 [Kitasatospora sp. NPDC101447]|uniref:hypothetical protein n=1 Tax=Kitasatospora sp. NPDC101447 TaxID=3364102 RepID=UPI0038020658
MNTPSTEARPRLQPRPRLRPRLRTRDASAGRRLPRPDLRWAPVSPVATAALIGSRAPHDHYLIAAVVLLTITAQVCDTLRAIHAVRPGA